jgi:hypothetical protein
MNVQEVVYCREEEKEERKEEKEEEEMLFIQVIKIHYASTSCIYLHVLGDETFITATSYKDDSSESRGGQ